MLDWINRTFGVLSVLAILLRWILFSAGAATFGGWIAANDAGKDVDDLDVFAGDVLDELKGRVLDELEDDVDVFAGEGFGENEDDVLDGFEWAEVIDAFKDGVVDATEDPEAKVSS